jgi:hypothetical protein
MGRRLAGIELAHVVSRSISCDTFSSQRISNISQCGLCSSCLLRRQALYASGMSQIDPESGYRFDVTNPREHLDEQRLYHLHSMLDQVELLRTCIEATSPWEELTEHFPVLEEIKGDVAEFEGRGAREIADALVRLYRAYVREWDSFPYHLAKRTRNGSIWPTAQVIDSPQRS